MNKRCVTVPLGEVPIPKNAKPEPPPALVLVVDDEPSIADTLSEILRRNGFAVLTAYDVDSALALVSVAPPEILLSDVSLGSSDGIQLACAVEDLVPDCRILLISALGRYELLDRMSTIKRKFNLKSKPFDPEELLEELARMEGRRTAVPSRDATPAPSRDSTAAPPRDSVA